MELTERQGTKADEKWLWTLYEQLMKEAISNQWGWDEDFQKQNFETELAADKFRIVSQHNINVAAYLLDEGQDHYFMRMLLVVKEFQNKGIGSKLIEQIRSNAKIKDKSVKLNVIKSNPVLWFYKKLGFTVFEESDDFYKLVSS